jgi:GAF domain-containing protein
LIIGDAHKDGRWSIAEDDQTHAVMIAPLFGQFDLLGILVLAHEQADYFSLEHLLLLQAIASQAAMAIENARLFAGMEQEHQRLNAIIQSVTEAVLLFDDEKRLLMINAVGQKLFTGNMAVGQFLEEGIGYESLISLLEKAYRTHEPQTGLVVFPDRQELSASATPLQEGGLVVTLHDSSSVSTDPDRASLISKNVSASL